MTIRRILFGLDRLPRGLAPDDPRLPGVTPGPQPLRLNSEPLPADVPAPTSGDHAARVAAVTQWLCAQCGDYAPQRQQFVRCYLDAMASHLLEHRAPLDEALRRFHGLYVPEDWLWSALRPLPRAWLVGDAGVSGADIAFWDGARAIVIGFGAMPSPSAATASGNIPVELAPADLADATDRLMTRLPDVFRQFWRNETLPCSPFRRAIPDGVVVAKSNGVTA